MKKKLISAALAAVMALCLSGCGITSVYLNYRPLEKLILISTIGVDASGGEVTLTACSDMGIDGSPPKVYTAGADTLPAAVEKLESSFSLNEAFFSHAEHLVIGEETARGGIYPYLDYVARSIDMRLDTDLFIARGATAQECILNTAGNTDAASSMLKDIAEDVDKLAEGYVYTCGEVMSELIRSGSALAMGIELTWSDEAAPGSERELSMRPAGYAVLHGDTLVDFTDGSETRGVSIINDKVQSGNITARGLGGVTAALGITGIKLDVTAEFDDDGRVRSVFFDCKGKISIEGLSGYADLNDQAVLDAFSGDAGAQIERDIAAAMELGENLGFDYMGLGGILRIRHPAEFDRAQERWSETYPNVKYSVDTSFKIERAYDMDMPLRYGIGES